MFNRDHYWNTFEKIYKSLFTITIPYIHTICNIIKSFGYYSYIIYVSMYKEKKSVNYINHYLLVKLKKKQLNNRQLTILIW